MKSNNRTVAGSNNGYPMGVIRVIVNDPPYTHWVWRESTEHLWWREGCNCEIDHDHLYKPDEPVNP